LFVSPEIEVEWVVAPVVPKEVMAVYAVPGAVEYLQVAFSLVISERVVEVVLTARVPEGMPPERTGAVLSMVMEAADEVAKLPEVSSATASIVWTPSAASLLFQVAV
jgi:hypothetical protein